MKLSIFISLSFLLVFSTFINAEDIYLKNGVVFKNVQIKSADAWDVSIIWKGDRLYFSRLNIEKIENTAYNEKQLSLVEDNSGKPQFSDVYLKSGRVIKFVTIRDSTEALFTICTFPDFKLRKIARDQILNVGISQLENLTSTHEEKFNLPEEFLLKKMQEVVVNEGTQERNPDGERISLHFTPYFYSGDMTVDYSSQNAYQSFSSNVKASYDNTFGFEWKLKIPVTSNVTIVPFLISETVSYSVPRELSEEVQYRSGSTIKTTTVKTKEVTKYTDYRMRIGTTLSLYF